MKIRTYLLLLAVVFSTNGTLRSQEFTFDPLVTLNDFISIGEFNENGNQEGWAANASALAVENGAMRVTTISGDPHFFLNNIAGEEDSFTIVEMRLRIIDGATSWQMFWGDEVTPGYAGARSINISLAPFDDQFFIVHFEFSTVLAGKLTHFRLDPGNGSGTVVEVDYVRLGTISTDSDSDGLPDSVETNTGIFVSDRDTGTDPNQADTDQDGFNDHLEIQVGTDPNNADDVPVPGIENYSLNTAVYVVEVPITENAPTISVGTPTSFSISPALPSGIAIDPSTGIIGGSATESRAATDYTVHVDFAGGGSDDIILNLEVRNPFIEYTVQKQTLKLGREIPFEQYIPKIFGAAPTAYSISPDLPEGLLLDPDFGDILGTPQAVLPPTEYIVTASYGGFPDSSTTVIIAVLGDPVLTIDPTDALDQYTSIAEFNDDSDLTVFNANPRIAPLSIVDGSLIVETTGGDPFMSTGFQFEGACRIIEMRVKAIASGGTWQFFWGEDVDGRRSFGATGQPFNTNEIVDDGEFHVYRLDFTQATEAQLTAFRWDPSGGSGALYELDYVRIFNCVAPPPALDNLALAEGVVASASTFYDDNYPASDAIDGDLATSWFSAEGDAANLGTTPYVQVDLPVLATVTQVNIRGDREFFADGYSIFAGRIDLYGDDGSILFTADVVLEGEPTVVPYDIDYVLPTPQDDVRAVRFTSTDDESIEPGLAELEIIGSFQGDVAPPPVFETPILLSAKGSGSPKGILANFADPVDPEVAGAAEFYSISGQDLTVSEAIILDELTVLLKVAEFNNDQMTLMAGDLTVPIGLGSTLEAYWNFNEGEGDVTADLGGDHPGTLTGADGPAAWTDDAPTLQGENPFAISFDGVDDYVFTEYAGVGGSNPRTVSFWVKTTATTTHGLVAWGDSSRNATKYHIRVNPGTGTIRTEVQGGNNWGTTSIVDDQWHHIVSLVPDIPNVNNLDVRHYVDGVFDTMLGGGDEPITTDITGDLANPVSIGLRIQGGAQNFNHFAGLIDDVSIFEGALTDDQIADLGAGVSPLDVLEPSGELSFAVEPQDATVPESGTVTLSGEVNGTGAIGYQWHENGVALDGATGASLTLVDVSFDANGNIYSLEAYNQNGTFNTILSGNITLTVEGDPNITVGAGPGVLNLDGANNAVDTSTDGTNDQSRQNVDITNTETLGAGSYNATSWSYQAGQTGSVIPYVASATGDGGYLILAVGAQVDIDENGLDVDVTVPFGGSAFTLADGTEVFGGIMNPPGIGSQNPVKTNLASGGFMDHDNNNDGTFTLPTVGGIVDGFGHANLARSYAFSIEIEPVEVEPELSLADGLVAHWAFEGDYLDSQGVYDGEHRGTAEPVWVDGPFGKAISLDGVDQYVEITGGNEDDLDFEGGDLSISGWFRVGAFDKSWQAVIAKGEGNRWRVARRGSSDLLSYAGGTGDTGDVGPNVNDGAWHHFVAVTDSSARTELWIDGSLAVTTESVPVLGNNDFRVTIGNNPERLARSFNGDLDDMAIWNRVLSADEIAQLATRSVADIIGRVPPLDILFLDGNIVLTYQGTLLGADNVEGPYDVVDGASSPMTVAPEAARRFYQSSN